MAAQQHSKTLADAVGIVRQYRDIDAVLCRELINQAVRTVMDARTFWSATVKSGVLSVPASYSTGTISLTAGSTTVTGTTTAWEYADKVNTTVAAAVSRPGYLRVTPASMTGIDTDTVLYVTGGTAEVVPVVETTTTTFRGDFQQTHAAGFTITASNLAGRQLRLGNSYPIYTVKAVHSATELELDVPWAGTSVGSQTYEIVKMYYTMQPNIKDILSVVDQTAGVPLQIHVQQEALDAADPQRASSGDPICLADARPNFAGNMQYELYPPQTSARQLGYLYVEQWPELRKDGDRLPYFINPNVFIWLALAQAFRLKMKEKDPHYAPETANYYLGMAQRELMAAMAADDAKAQRVYTNEMSRFIGGGTNWRQSHLSEYDIDGQWW